MKPFVLISLLSSLLLISAKAQNQELKKKQNQPQENSKVTREYDEKGNLIKFDSVYSYSWSSDTTLMKDFSEQDFSDFFGSGFGFPNDSLLNNNSFFKDFDKMFSHPFGEPGANQDSIFQKHFNEMKQFHSFGDSDSSGFSFGNFGDLFDRFFENKSDSSSVKKQGKIAQKSPPKSMDDIMQLFQQQIQEMEKQQKQFFEGNKKLKQF